MFTKAEVGISDEDEQKRTPTDHLFRLDSINQTTHQYRNHVLNSGWKIRAGTQVFGSSEILDEYGDVSEKAQKVSVRKSSGAYFRLGNRSRSDV